MTQQPSSRQISVLVVDDQQYNLDIIEEYLADTKFKLDLEKDSVKAWTRLERNPRRYDIILLDWMMPNLDGMEMLKRIKADPKLKHIPVIMQTARTNEDDIRQGIEAGAYYYLTKPFDEDHLLSIVHAAVDDLIHLEELEHQLHKKVPPSPLPASANFRIRDLDEATRLASELARACPEPDKVVPGINELLVNAIEHGNLNIGYTEKSQLKHNGVWEKEIAHRLSLPEYKDKIVIVDFEKKDTVITITIRDEGKGFDWSNYLEFHPERMFDYNGRGIAMANIFSFDEIKYSDKGNVVTATIFVTNPKRH